MKVLQESKVFVTKDFRTSKKRENRSGSTRIHKDRKTLKNNKINKSANFLKSFTDLKKSMKINLSRTQDLKTNIFG